MSGIGNRPISFAQLQKESSEVYQELFDYFYKMHGLTLLEGEMQDIIYEVKEHEKRLKEKQVRQVDAIVIRPRSSAQITLIDDKYIVGIEILGEWRKIASFDCEEKARIYAKGFDKGMLILSLLMRGENTAEFAVNYIESYMDV